MAFGGVVVMDAGTGMVKAGMASEDRPRVVVRNVVGLPKHKRVVGEDSSKVYVGTDAEQHRGMLSLHHPMRAGVVEEWDYFLSVLHWEVMERDHPLLVTETPLNPRSNRIRMAQELLEGFNVPSVAFCAPGILSLYANGDTTGVVLDCGEGVCHSTPVYEGYSLPHSVMRADFGGRDVTEHLSVLLRRMGGHCFNTAAELEAVRQLKESCCFVRSKGGEGPSEQTHTLPDGTRISVGHEAIEAPEMLFFPRQMGLEHPGVHEILGNSIWRSEMDIRSRLLENVIHLVGGSTLFQQFPDRLLEEVVNSIRRIISFFRSSPCWIVALGVDELELYAAYRGGAVLANLTPFRQLLVTGQELKEEGDSVLFRRSLL